jgi:hypothetical protein
VNLSRLLGIVWVNKVLSSAHLQDGLAMACVVLRR